jgi:hypothetical protein
MIVHSITRDNYTEANDAIRDILFLYQDAVTSYRGFGATSTLEHSIPSSTSMPLS